MGTNASAACVKEISTNVAVTWDLLELNGTFTLALHGKQLLTPTGSQAATTTTDWQETKKKY